MRKAQFALILLVAAAGCGQPFGPQTLVDKPRFLAIRAEPPEIGLDSQFVNLDLLVATPSGEADVQQCTWAACIVNLGWAAGQIDCPGKNSLVFSNTCHGARLDVEELVDWLSGLDWSDLGPPGNSEQLSDLMGQQLPLFVGVEVEIGGTSLRGIKRLRINIDGDEPNGNPSLVGIEVMEGPAPGELVSSGDQLRLRPLVAEGSSQAFTDPDTGEPRQEDMLFSWFSNAGEFEERRTILDTDSHGNPLDVNTWHLTPKWSSPGPVWVWVVVRDGRWGCDWTSIGFTLKQD
ncbi:MAG: hypothetical protein D6806_01520 [Deltaproteobacteria bacterium]|nr:MAG: hypothetical protein D6806_01520 [Deltaproteobacteria bacterium]